MDKNDSNQYKENELENFDVVYRKNMEIQREFEKIELTYAQTVKEYKNYEECIAFIDYLKTIEKIFAEAKIRNWDASAVKDSLIETKISLISDSSPLKKDVLDSIRDSFQKAGVDIEKIYEASRILLEKYGQDQECVDLIYYIQNVFTSFSPDDGRGNQDLSVIKDRLISARMQVISSNGKPPLITLEKIYQDFKYILEGENA